MLCVCAHRLLLPWSDKVLMNLAYSHVLLNCAAFSPAVRVLVQYWQDKKCEDSNSNILYIYLLLRRNKIACLHCSNSYTGSLGFTYVCHHISKFCDVRNRKTQNKIPLPLHQHNVLGSYSSYIPSLFVVPTVSFVPTKRFLLID